MRYQSAKFHVPNMFRSYEGTEGALCALPRSIDQKKKPGAGRVKQRKEFLPYPINEYSPYFFENSKTMIVTIIKLIPSTIIHEKIDRIK